METSVVAEAQGANPLQETFTRWRSNALAVAGRLALVAGLAVAPSAAMLAADQLPAAADQSMEFTGPGDRYGNLDVNVRSWCDSNHNITNVDLYDKGYSDYPSGTLVVNGETHQVRSIVGGDIQTHRFATRKDNMPITFTLSDGTSKTMTSDCRYNPNVPLPTDGYWMLADAGYTHSFGIAGQYCESIQNATHIEPTPSSNGFWVSNSRGVVISCGDAPQLESDPFSLKPLHKGEQVTSLSSTPSGKGYWLFTTEGRVMPYGDAQSYGDMAGKHLNAPVINSVPTPSGKGYYMVAGDGGVFTFGDAVFKGSTGDKVLNAPVEALVPDPNVTDGGYWLVASDGGVFSFNAEFHGSMGGQRLNQPITGMVAYGKGYLMVAADGGVFTFSDRAFVGSLGNNPSPSRIVSIAAYKKQS